MSYEAYKQDTNYVANWLAQTARQSGIKFSLINKLARGWFTNDLETAQLIVLQVVGHAVFYQLTYLLN